MRIQLKRSDSLENGKAKAPKGSQLEFGELALNYNTKDPSLYIKDSAGQLIRLAGRGALGIGDASISLSGGNGVTGGGTINLEDSGSKTFTFSVDLDTGNEGGLEFSNGKLKVKAATGDKLGGIKEPGASGLFVRTKSGDNYIWTSAGLPDFTDGKGSTIDARYLPITGKAVTAALADKAATADLATKAADADKAELADKLSKKVTVGTGLVLDSANTTGELTKDVKIDLNILTGGGLEFDSNGKLKVSQGAGGQGQSGGNAATATRAGAADAAKIEVKNDSAEYFPIFVANGSAADQTPAVDVDLKYNPGTNTLTVANLVGNAATATTATTATAANTVAVTANNTENKALQVPLVDGVTGNLALETDTGITYNPSSNTLTVATVAGNATSATAATSATTATTATNCTRKVEVGNGLQYDTSNSRSTDGELDANVKIDLKLATDSGLTVDSNGLKVTSSTSSQTADRSTAADKVKVTSNSNQNKALYITYVDGETGDLALNTDDKLTYNPAANTLFTNLSGNASTATLATRATNADNATAAGTATTATNATNAVTATNCTRKIVPGTGLALGGANSSGVLNSDVFLKIKLKSGGGLDADADGLFASSTSNRAGASDKIKITESAVNKDLRPIFVDGSSGDLDPHVDAGLTFNPATNTLTATTFAGNARTATESVRANVATLATRAKNSNNADKATTSDKLKTKADDSTAAEQFITFVPQQAADSQEVATDSALKYNSGTNTLTATNFAGNASTASTAGSATTAGRATNSDKVKTTSNDAEDKDLFPLFVDGQTGDKDVNTDASLTWNPSTNTLTAANVAGTATNATTATTAVNCSRKIVAGHGLELDTANNQSTDGELDADVGLKLKLQSGSGLTVDATGLKVTASATSGRAGVADQIKVVPRNTNNTSYLVNFTEGTGDKELHSDDSLTYNPSTNTLTCPNITGTASLATAAVSVNTTATSNQTADMFPLFATANSTSAQTPFTDSNLKFNPNTNTLTATTFAGTATSATNCTRKVEIGNGLQYDTTSSRSNDGELDANVKIDLKLASNSGLTLDSNGLKVNSTTPARSTAADKVKVTANENEAKELQPLFVDGTSGDLDVNVDGGLKYNPSTNSLTADKFLGVATTALTATKATTADSATTAATATTATRATNSDKIKVTQSANNETDVFPLLSKTTANGDKDVQAASQLKFNVTTNTLTATNFAGNATSATTANTANSATTATTATTATNCTRKVVAGNGLEMGSGNTSGTLNADVNFSVKLASNSGLTTGSAGIAIASNFKPATAVLADKSTLIEINPVGSSDSGTFFIPFVANNSNSQQELESDADLKYNPATNTLTAAVFAGNATSATSANTATTATSATSATNATNCTRKVVPGFGLQLDNQSGQSSDGTINADVGLKLKLASNSGLSVDANGLKVTTTSVARSTASDKIKVQANNTENKDLQPLFVDGSTGDLDVKVDTGLKYNPSSNALTAAKFLGTATTAENTTQKIEGGKQISIGNQGHGQQVLTGTGVHTFTLDASNRLNGFTFDGAVCEQGEAFSKTGGSGQTTADLDLCESNVYYNTATLTGKVAINFKVHDVKLDSTNGTTGEYVTDTSKEIGMNAILGNQGYTTMTVIQNSGANSFIDTVTVDTNADVTVYWQGGKPTAGNTPASGKTGVDIYTFTIHKLNNQGTGSKGTYRIYANMTYFESA